MTDLVTLPPGLVPHIACVDCCIQELDCRLVLLPVIWADTYLHFKTDRGYCPAGTVLIKTPGTVKSTFSPSLRIDPLRSLSNLFSPYRRLCQLHLTSQLCTVMALDGFPLGPSTHISRYSVSRYLGRVSFSLHRELRDFP